MSAATRDGSELRVLKPRHAPIGAEARKHEFEDLVKRFKNATDPKEIKRLGNELGRMIFSG